MIRKAAILGASAFALVLSTPALADHHEEDAATTQAKAEPATPTMSFGTWGIDPTLLSSEIAPGDDFFAHANQEWLDANPLPAEFSRFGAFNLLREKSTTDVKALIVELAAKPADELSADEARIMAVYKAYLDTDAIEAAGLAPAQGHLNKIVTAQSLGDLAMLWAKPGYPSPFGGFVSVDAKQPDQYVAYLGFGGLGLPDRDYYLDESEKGREIQQKYKDYIAFLLGEAGYADPVAAAEAVYALEDKIARDIEWDRTVRRNRDLTYNVVTGEEIAAWAGEFPALSILDATGLSKSPKYVVGQLPPSDERAKELGLDEATRAKIGSGLPGMLALVNETPVATLQAWTIKEFLSDHADVLPSRFDEARFELYGKTLQVYLEYSAYREFTMHIRQDAAGYARTARPLEACDRRDRRRTGRTRRQVLRRPLLPAREQGGDGGTGREPARGARPVDR